MCGIAGTVNMGSARSLRAMTEKLAHRGPDDFGYWELDDPAAGSVMLGSRRLSILDLSPAGHMPMTSGDGRFTITYNGEVYNHQELRQGLLEKGHRFRSKSDTETVLCLYQEYGAECVTRLNGMFAFAIWDASRKCLFVARDHFGIKPFYYFHRGRQFAFSSELHSLLETPELSRDLDWQALDQYLTFLWVPEPGTMLKGISKLPPGHSAVLKDGNLVLDRYWGLEILMNVVFGKRTLKIFLKSFGHDFATVCALKCLATFRLGHF